MHTKWAKGSMKESKIQKLWTKSNNVHFRGVKWALGYSALGSTLLFGGGLLAMKGYKALKNRKRRR